MATFTISAPKELSRLRKEHPETDWNEVMKRGILRRLAELKKFEELRKRGVFEDEDKFNALLKKAEE